VKKGKVCHRCVATYLALAPTPSRTDGGSRPIADHADDISPRSCAPTGRLASSTVLAVEGTCFDERGSTLLTTCYFGRLIAYTGIHAEWIGLVICLCKLEHEPAVDIGQEKIGWKPANYSVQLAMVPLDPTGRS